MPRLPRLLLATLLTAAALAPSLPAHAGVAPPRSRHDLQSFMGLGTWVDAFDYSREYAGSNPPVAPVAAVDAMWRAGVKTLYIQAAKFGDKSPNALLSPDLLAGFLGRAHYRNMRVVAWYLPSFTNTAKDLAHFLAIRDFRTGGQAFDGIGVDIEWRGESNVDTRNARLVDLTKRLRAAVPHLPLSGIVLPPVVTDVINKAYWPRFPWMQLRSHYDVWQPMGYWTNRTASSGWRDAYKYTYENIRLTRKNLGMPYAKVSAVGGIGNAATTTDYREFIRATNAQKSMGASVYDWHTTAASAYPTLRTAPVRP